MVYRVSILSSEATMWVCYLLCLARRREARLPTHTTTHPSTQTSTQPATPEQEMEDCVCAGAGGAGQHQPQEEGAGLQPSILAPPPVHSG